MNWNALRQPAKRRAKTGWPRPPAPAGQLRQSAVRPPTAVRDATAIGPPARCRVSDPPRVWRRRPMPRASPSLARPCRPQAMSDVMKVGETNHPTLICRPIFGPTRHDRKESAASRRPLSSPQRQAKLPHRCCARSSPRRRPGRPVRKQQLPVANRLPLHRSQRRQCNCRPAFRLTRHVKIARKDAKRKGMSEALRGKMHRPSCRSAKRLR